MVVVPHLLLVLVLRIVISIIDFSSLSKGAEGTLLGRQLSLPKANIKFPSIFVLTLLYNLLSLLVHIGHPISSFKLNLPLLVDQSWL